MHGRHASKRGYGGGFGGRGLQVERREGPNRACRLARSGGSDGAERLRTLYPLVEGMLRARPMGHQSCT